MANTINTTNTNDEQAICNVVATWQDATRKGDVAAILPLMTEDVVFMIAGQPTMTGRDSFAEGMRKMMRTHRIVSDGVVEEVGVSGDLAYARTRLEVRIEPLAGGVAVRRAGYTLSVFRRNAGGQWQIARDANMLAPVTDGMSDG